MAVPFAKRLEVVANIGIVLVSFVLVATVLERNRVWPFSRRLRADIRVGQSFQVGDVSWRPFRASLVVAFRRDCGFCLESVPLYQRLSRAALRNNIQVVALLPEPVAESKRFLESEGIRVDAARSIALARPAIARTPMLLLVNPNGVVKALWPGKLPESQERVVLQAVENAK